MPEIVLLFILGAMIGSFLNVCIYRLPRNESVVFPSSHCPKCQKKIAFYDLIPILSYFLLGRKCRYCGARISFRYTLVEILCGYVLVWLYGQQLFVSNFIFAAIFSYLLITIFFIDAEHQVIPDSLNIGLLFTGLIYNLLRATLLSSLRLQFHFFSSALLGVVVGFAVLWSIGFLGKIWFKKQAMGEGDIFLAAALGACLGIKGVLLAILLAYFLAAGVALYLLATGRTKMGQYIPFGPALASGGILALFYGPQIIDWYMRLFS